MMLMRIQRRRTKGWRMPAGAVSVTRPGPWGNPYYPGSGLSRGFFDANMRPAQYDVRDPRVQVKWFRERMAEMARDRSEQLRENFIKPLREKNLACWCKLCPAHEGGKPLGVHCDSCEPCHADVLLEYVNPEIAGKLTFCDCAEARVQRRLCRHCYDGDDCPDDDRYEDPPLYPPGKLAGMSLEELERESDRQAGRQGSLGDAEHIDEMAVQETESRWRLVDNEIKRRKESP